MTFKHLKIGILILFGYWILDIGYLGTSVFAQSSTDSAQTLRDSVRQKVNEELSQIKKAVSKKAYLGVISEKSEASLTLTTPAKQTRTVIVSTDATIVLKNGTDGTLADLKVSGNVLAIGDVDSAGVMTAKRVLIIAAPSIETRRHVYAQIKTISSSSLTLTVKDTDPVTAKFTSALTAVTTLKENQQIKAKTTDLKPGQTVVAIINSDTKSPYFTDIFIQPASATSSPTLK